MKAMDISVFFIIILLLSTPRCQSTFFNTWSIANSIQPVYLTIMPVPLHRQPHFSSLVSRSMLTATQKCLTHHHLQFSVLLAQSSNILGHLLTKCSQACPEIKCIRPGISGIKFRYLKENEFGQFFLISVLFFLNRTSSTTIFMYKVRFWNCFCKSSKSQ